MATIRYKLTAQVMGQLDTGPTTCHFMKLKDNAGDDFADVVQSLRWITPNDPTLRQVKTLCNTLEEFKHLSEPKRKAIIQNGVVGFIFATNQLEFTGCLNKNDASQIVCGSSTGVEDRDHATTRVWALLKDIYNPDICDPSKLTSLIPMPEDILDWHKALLSGDPFAGKYRTGMGYTTKIGCKEPHVYPHSSLVRKQLQSLCYVVYNMAAMIERQSASERKIAFIFELAAFFQFHFVDIHPFHDGNGRLCRLLSKRILDSVLPAPFSMFPNRDLYLQTLQECRSSGDLSSLTHLLLTCATAEYGQMMDLGFRVLLFAETTEELKELIEKNNLQAHESEIEKLFKTLRPGQPHEQLEFTDVKVLVKREPSLKGGLVPIKKADSDDINIDTI